MKKLALFFICFLFFFNSCEEYKKQNTINSVKKRNTIKKTKDTTQIKAKQYYITFTTGVEKLNLVHPNFNFTPDSINVSFKSIVCMNLNEWNKANYFAFHKEQYNDLIKRKPKIFRLLKSNIKSYGQYIVKGKKISFPLIEGVMRQHIPDSSYINAEIILINIYKKGIKYNIPPIISKITQTKP